MLTARLQTLTWQSPEGPKSLAYRQWGEADNPHILLCVHGLTRNSADFHTLAQTLGKSVRLVAPDMPGRGQSDWLANAQLYALPTYVSACMALIAELRPSQLDWLGTSMGGLIGIGYASLPPSIAPHPVRKLILNDVGPSLNLQALERIAYYVGTKPRFNSQQDARNAIRADSQTFGPHTEEQWNALCDAVLMQEQGQWTRQHDPAIGEAFKHMDEATLLANETALWAAYDAIQADTLVIRGEQSDLLSVQTLGLMSKRGPQARTLEIKGVGHAPTLMQLDQIQVVHDFLF